MPIDLPMKIVVVGCGNVATNYAKTLVPFKDQAEIVGFCDLDPARSRAFAEEHGGRVYETLEEVLADESIHTILNLTIHTAHYEVITKCLMAGKHVYSEKPLAMKADEAKELVQLADDKNLVLCGAPMNFLGEAQQTLWKTIRDGSLGEPRLVYAEVNHGRIEAWHPNPGPFYAVGPLYDVGVYPLTLATTFFGPITRVVSGYARVLFPDRVTKEGEKFHIETPEFITAVLETEQGVVVRLTTNFYVHSNNTHQKGRFEVHGDAGSAILDNFQQFSASVTSAAFGEEMQTVPPVQEPRISGQEFGKGVADMAEALAEGRTPRVTGRQAAHVVDVLEAVLEAGKTHRPVDVTSRFDPPLPMPWAQ
ncbi:MAG: Gfo/Idh/MocA family protein [Phycisphaeraceae bacterium]